MTIAAAQEITIRPRPICMRRHYRVDCNGRTRVLQVLLFFFVEIIDRPTFLWRNYSAFVVRDEVIPNVGPLLCWLSFCFLYMFPLFLNRLSTCFLSDHLFTHPDPLGCQTTKFTVKEKSTLFRFPYDFDIFGFPNTAAMS